MKRTDVGGTAVYDSGAGTPVLLLHGGLGSHANWLPFVEAAGSDIRFILIDTPGHGESASLDTPLSYPAVADRIASVIDELDVQRPVVMGWSDGGQVALELAVRHPNSIGAIIVGGAYPEFDRGGIREKHRLLLGAGEDGRPNLEWLDMCLGDEGAAIKSRHPGGADQWRALVEGTANMWLGYAGLSDEEIGTVAVPALVLGADGDELITAERAVELFRLLARGQLAIVPDVDHDAIQTSERAARFVGPVRDFLEGVVSDGATRGVPSPSAVRDA